VLKISIFHLSSVPETCLPDKHILLFCGKGVRRLPALASRLSALIFCLLLLPLTTDI
jgi:hypothetical protein